ncbi:unnamed protein product [Victoria cruziana]
MARSVSDGGSSSIFEEVDAFPQAEEGALVDVVFRELFLAGGDAAVEAFVTVVDYAVRRCEVEVGQWGEHLVLGPFRRPVGLGRRLRGLLVAAAEVVTAGVGAGEEGAEGQQQEKLQRLEGPAW